MAFFHSTLLYSLTPGGTNQFTVSGEIANAEASGDATDDTISVGENVPVSFTDPGTEGTFGGSYIYDGYESGLSGYVAHIGSNYYLFSNDTVPLNQNFNIQPNDVAVCYFPGTRIAIPSGEMAIERLVSGDLVTTSDGRAVPVKWIGRQTISILFGIPEGRQPVVITAGALGEGLPRNDLRVTSDHALLLDDVLVQAGALVNGTTIRRIPGHELGKQFVVYHIETENHGLILAEGTPAETFVDNVTRRAFDNFAEYDAMYGDAPAQIIELEKPRVKSRRQLSPIIRARLDAIAARLMSPIDKVA